MAVISSKPQSAGQSADGPDKDKKNIPVKIDLNDTSIPDGEAQEIDKAADAYAFSAPPPHGIYQMGIFLDSSGFRMGKSDDNDPSTLYFLADLDCRVISDDKDINGISIQETVSTTVFRGQKTSQMATLIVKLGYSEKLPANPTPKQQSKLLAGILKRDPKAFAELDWRAWSKNEMDARRGKAGKFILRGMEKFPQLADGSYDHIIEDKSGEQCFARAHIIRWLSSEEAKSAKAEPKKAARVEQAVAQPAAGGKLDTLDDLDF